jgi:predicted nucleotide-binding protein
MLRRWDLDPLILDQLPSSGQTVIEKLEEYINQANFGVVPATPEDMGYSAKEAPENAKARVRQNVVLELGILLSKKMLKKPSFRLQRKWRNADTPSRRQSFDIYTEINNLWT